MTDRVEVNKVSNGYIVKYGVRTNVCLSLEDVFHDLLLHFEGRCESFNGNSYGRVIIKRIKVDDVS